VTRMRITVSENGPYKVQGGVPLSRAEIVTNDKGESVGWRELERYDVPDRYELCRCGQSKTKPFCDWTHFDIGFDGTETAGHHDYMEASACITGSGVRLHDLRELCAEARFCDRAGGLWNLINDADDPEIRALVEEEAMLCPSGRYTVCDPSDSPKEFDYEPSIVIIEDPQMGMSGPLFVRGRVEIVSESGESYEVRNRVTLCRCGASENKPFCDGSHLTTEFRDGL
jgi:CDGSH-type Zn-finger protein